jgi:translation initiation factor 5A
VQGARSPRHTRPSSAIPRAHARAAHADPARHTAPHTPPQIEEITTSKTGKHGHAKANYYGYDIFTGKRYEDVAPTTHNVNVPIVTRTEYILTDINDDDSTEDGSIVVLMTDRGDSREDLRLPDGPEYKQLRDAFLDGAKEILVTVINAMGINKIGARAGGGGRKAARRGVNRSTTHPHHPVPLPPPRFRRADSQYATKEIGAK